MSFLPLLCVLFLLLLRAKRNTVSDKGLEGDLCCMLFEVCEIPINVELRSAPLHTTPHTPHHTPHSTPRSTLHSTPRHTPRHTPHHTPHSTPLPFPSPYLHFTLPSLHVASLRNVHHEPLGRQWTPHDATTTSTILETFHAVRFASLHFLSLHFTSLPFASLRFASLHLTSAHLSSAHLTSLHFTHRRDEGSRLDLNRDKRVLKSFSQGVESSVASANKWKDENLKQIRCWSCQVSLL